MRNVGCSGRSFKKISKADLRRLARLAAHDRCSFFASHPAWRLYQDRVIAVALCQGAASHFVDGTTGINDFDVYTIYAAHPARHWYAKRNKHCDFGHAKFGQSTDRPDYVGRRVDLLARGIAFKRGEDPADAVRRWLASGATKSAKLLAKKAVVLLEPAERCGEVVWPLITTRSRHVAS